MNMNKFSSFLFFSVLVVFSSCKTTQPISQTNTSQKAAENTGFYQFSNEDPKASPFFAKKPSVYGKNGMVAATHPVASQVGVDILKMGGNAIDAAVATQFALAVVHPAAGNIGGGGFLVFRDKTGKSYTLDYREKAPENASRDMYLDEKGDVKPGHLSWYGHTASGTPGAVDGLEQAHKRFGKLTWQQILQPAIDLAENGVPLTMREARGLNRTKEDFVKYNPSKSYFVKPDTITWKEGELLIQKDLAKTLRRIQEQGRKGFYEGETARLLLEEMKRGGAIITQKDLDNYRATWREPIIESYKNMKIISMPPPSSGGIALVQLLKYVEPYPLTRWGWHTDSTTQVMIEAERRVFADRATFLGDPDFVKVPQKELLSSDFIKNRWQDFQFSQASDSKVIKAGKIAGYERQPTHHFWTKKGMLFPSLQP
jgi:gamma-glutamyltranspeptidase / glutathione hydrolase